jgi:hypothetical protein
MITGAAVAAPVPARHQRTDQPAAPAKIDAI